METGPNITIIGAGPSGLVAALTLVQEGQRVAIYDALPKGQNGSRAAGVHAHTLEQLHTLGYAEALISKGIKGQGAINYDRTTPLMQTSFAEYLQGVTEYPFVLLIPQHEVEHFLEERLNDLGVKVRREMRLKEIEASGAEGIKLTFENGETAKATYLIGADGSRSTVRERADISFANPFNGEPYNIPHSEAIEKQPQYLVLADVVLEGSYPSTFLRDHLSITIDPSGMVLLVPLPLPDDINQHGAERLTFWRVIFPVTAKNEPPPAKPDVADVQQYFDKRRSIWEEKDWPKVLEVRESSRYRVREAMASTMYKPFGTHGHVLLVGDAAHVHSPAGGQGMNLGICDAVSLGRTLSKYISNGTQGSDLLEEYSRKRQIVAKNVIQLATTALNMMNYLIAMPALVRRLIAGALDFMRFAKRRTVLQISGVMNRAYD